MCYTLMSLSTAIARVAEAASKEVKSAINPSIIERLMGEISKRCKQKWMGWTGR